MGIGAIFATFLRGGFEFEFWEFGCPQTVVNRDIFATMAVHMLLGGFWFLRFNNDYNVLFHILHNIHVGHTKNLWARDLYWLWFIFFIECCCDGPFRIDKRSKVQKLINQRYNIRSIHFWSIIIRLTYKVQLI